ncbi:Ribonuclease H-like domain containing protein [Naviculisporaceae sp. PSN 640]
MAPQELSSNWKKLQAKIKAESSVSGAKSSAASSSKATTSLKRKAGESSVSASASHPAKKKKFQQEKPSHQSQSRPHPQAKAKTSTTAPQKEKEKKPPAKMGQTQSSKLDPVIPGKGISPSLSLWAADNDISPEDLAEAYQLGSSSSSSRSRNPGSLLLTDQPPRPNEGLAPNIQDTLSKAKYLSLDCEMVGIGEGGYDSALARVSIVDFHGRQVYDSFVRPKQGIRAVTDWRTEISGVSPRHMATARSFEQVQAQVAQLLKDRILVGHDVRHDLAVLELEHSPKFIRDTSKFPGFRKYGNGLKPSLRVLAKEILGVEIQTGQHSSIEDARVTMLLFRKHKAAFDVDHANRFPDTAPKKLKGKPNKSAKKKK